MSITLENTSKRPWVFNLDHQSLASETNEHGPQEIKVITVDHLATGELIPRHEKKTVPGSLTLLSGERRDGLPEGVLQCDQVKAAIRLGEVRVVKQDEAAPAAKTTTNDEKEPAR